MSGSIAAIILNGIVCAVPLSRGDLRDPGSHTASITVPNMRSGLILENFNLDTVASSFATNNLIISDNCSGS